MHAHWSLVQDSIFLVHAHTTIFFSFSPHVTYGKVVYYHHISAWTGICNRVVEVFTRCPCVHELVECAPTSVVGHYTGRLVVRCAVCALTMGDCRTRVDTG